VEDKVKEKEKQKVNGNKAKLGEEDDKVEIHTIRIVR